MLLNLLLLKQDNNVSPFLVKKLENSPACEQARVSGCWKNALQHYSHMDDMQCCTYTRQFWEKPQNSDANEMIFFDPHFLVIKSNL